MDACPVPEKIRLNSEWSGADRIVIHVISRSSGKPAITRAARFMASDPNWRQQRMSVRDLDAALGGAIGSRTMTSQFSQVIVGSLTRTSSLYIMSSHPRVNKENRPSCMDSLLGKQPLQNSSVFHSVPHDEVLMRPGTVIATSTPLYPGPGRVLVRAIRNP